MISREVLPDPLSGTRAHVYRNLHRRCWSIRVRGKVIGHRDEVALTDCRFVIQPGGQQRARREGRRNVHAYIAGVIACPPPEPGRQIAYNPFRHDTFVWRDGGEPVMRASMVVMTAGGKAFAV